MKRIFLILATLFVLYPRISLSAPVLFSGFEADAGNSPNLGSDGEFSATNSTTQSGTVHSGTYAARLTATAGANAFVRFGCFNATGVVSACSVNHSFSSFWVNIATAPASANEGIFRVSTNVAGTQKFELRLASSGVLQSYDQSGTLMDTGATVIPLNTWTFIQCDVPNSVSGTYSCKINGVTEITSGSHNFLASDTGYVFFGKEQNANTQSIDYFFDDVSVDDTAFPSDVKVIRLAPNANGTTMQWAGGTNASDWNEVKEAPTDNDTTYVAKSASSTQTALFNFVDTGTAGITGTIQALRLHVRMRDTVGGSSSTFPEISSSGTTNDKSATTLGTSYANFFNLLATDPHTTLAWTTGGVDAVQGGVVDTAAINTPRATTIDMMVDYIPGAAVTTTGPSLSMMGFGG